MRVRQAGERLAAFAAQSFFSLGCAASRAFYQCTATETPVPLIVARLLHIPCVNFSLQRLPHPVNLFLKRKICLAYEYTDVCTDVTNLGELPKFPCVTPDVIQGAALVENLQFDKCWWKVGLHKGNVGPPPADTSRQIPTGRDAEVACDVGVKVFEVGAASESLVEPFSNAGTEEVLGDVVIRLARNFPVAKHGLRAEFYDSVSNVHLTLGMQINWTLLAGPLQSASSGVERVPLLFLLLASFELLATHAFDQARCLHYAFETDPWGFRLPPNISRQILIRRVFDTQTAANEVTN